MRKEHPERTLPRPTQAAPAGYRRSLGRVGIALMALTLVASPRTLLGTDPGSVVIVVNSAGPLRTLAAEQIRDIFRGRLRLVADVAVQPVQLRGPTRQLVLRVLLDMSEREFQLYWMRKTYEDGVLPPTVRTSAEEVLQHVGREKGAIGFVDAASIRATDQVTVVYEVHPEGSSP